MTTAPTATALRTGLRVLACSVGAWLAMASATVRAEPVTLLLGTATPGGGYAVYGEAFAAAIHAADPGLVIETRTTAGSAENLPALEAGRLDLALVQGTTARAAFAAPNGPRVISAMYSSPGLFAVRADAPIERLDDLRGRRVVFGARGSGLGAMARSALAALDLDLERDFDAVFVDRAGDAPAMVADGSALALWGGGIGWPPFSAVAANAAGARFIGFSAGEIERIHARFPFLAPMTVPKGAYPGIDRPIRTVGVWDFILARPDLPDEVAHRLAGALHRAVPQLAARLPRAAETTAENTLAAVPRPELLHPGVARHLREIGLLR